MTFELDEGDTGEALLLPDLLKYGQLANAAVDSEPALAGGKPTAGLPEYLHGLKGQIVGLQLDLATANVDHAQTLLNAAAEVESLKWSLAYWEWGARFGRRKRVWRTGWDHWSLGLSVDEYSRRTLVLGPFVVALWGCRCTDCKAERADLEAIIDGPEEES